MANRCSVHAAFRKTGIQCYTDLNAPDFPSAGTGILDVCQDSNFHRHSTNRAFLPAALTQERKARLKICTNTLVTKIELVNEAGQLRATGVHLEAETARKAGQKYYAAASKEVILCAGALGSPQLLMLR